MGSICEKCFGSGDKKPPHHQQQQQQRVKATSLRQMSQKSQSKQPLVDSQSDCGPGYGGTRNGSFSPAKSGSTPSSPSPWSGAGSAVGTESAGSPTQQSRKGEGSPHLWGGGGTRPPEDGYGEDSGRKGRNSKTSSPKSKTVGFFKSKQNSLSNDAPTRRSKKWKK